MQIPEYLQAWVYQALQPLQYANLDQTYGDILKALNQFKFLSPRTDYLPGSSSVAFVLNGTDELNHNIILWVPQMYPQQPPILSLDGSFRRMASPTNIAEAIELRNTPLVPPKLPEVPKRPPKLPAKGAKESPALPPKPPKTQSDTHIYNGGSHYPPPVPPVPHAVGTPNALHPMYGFSPGVEAHGIQPNITTGYTMPPHNFEHSEKSILSPTIGTSGNSTSPISSLGNQGIPRKKTGEHNVIDLMNEVSLHTKQSSERQAALDVLVEKLNKCTPAMDIGSINNDIHTLNSLESQIQQQRQLLLTREEQHHSNIKMLKTHTEAASSLIARADSQLIPSEWEELVNVADKPIEDAKAADMAISDLLQVLPKALDAGSMELHVYLRLVRQYAREQFGHRYLLHMPPPRPPKK